MKTDTKKAISFSGKVIHGDKYGSKIGFPTINMDRRNFKSLQREIKFGIYKGEVVLDNKNYKAGIIIGPLDKNNLPKLEAHLLNYKGNAYGKKVVFKLHEFLRKYKIFKTEKELIIQIGKDLKKC
jgi:riboflavin kinase/FMN adenylyltransferase